MDILTWLIVGLVAGVLASFVVRGGYGLLGDIVVGIVGAFIGGWIFGKMGWHTPFGGWPARSSSPSSARRPCSSAADPEDKSPSPGLPAVRGSPQFLQFTFQASRLFSSRWTICSSRRVTSPAISSPISSGVYQSG